MSDAYSRRQWLQAGLLIRGQLRRAMLREGIKFTEHKSMLESVFIIEEPPEVYHRLVRILQRQGVMG